MRFRECLLEPMQMLITDTGIRRCALLLVAFSLVTSQFGSAKAAGVVVEGNVKMRMHMPWGATQEQARVFFTMHIDDCKWLVRFVREEGTNAVNAPDYEEASCDGTNIYYLSNIRRAVEAQRRKGVRMAENVAHGESYVGQVFNLRRADEIGPIWLAFASACYLETRTNDLVEPAMAFDGFGERYGPPLHKKVRATWALSSSRPRFPTRVSYMSDGYKRTQNGQVKLPPPFDKGFTNAVYEVEAFTNVIGGSFPLACSLTLYKPKPTATTARDLTVFVEYHINLKSVATNQDMTTFQPAIPGVTTLQDERYGKMWYNATSQWPTAAELRTNRYFQEVRRINTRPIPARSPWVVRICLAMLMILPLAAYVGWRLIHSRKEWDSESL